MPDLILWKTRQLSRMKQEIDQMFGELYRQFGASELAHGGKDCFSRKSLRRKRS